MRFQLSKMYLLRKGRGFKSLLTSTKSRNIWSIRFSKIYIEITYQQGSMGSIHHEPLNHVDLYSRASHTSLRRHIECFHQISRQHKRRRHFVRAHISQISGRTRVFSRQWQMCGVTTRRGLRKRVVSFQRGSEMLRFYRFVWWTTKTPWVRWA